MPLLKRHKYILMSLGIYWPALFVLTHIPVPQIAEQSGMSDKTMHLLAYLILVFFVWVAISPYEKVRWNKPKTWIILAIIVCYGAFDEWLQGRMGRQMELMDLVSDFLGVAIGLIILSILSFWLALLAVSAIFIFAITNLSHLLGLYPQYHLNTVFHLTAYSAATLIWIQYLDRKPGLERRRPLWPLRAICPPLLLLGAVLGGSVYYDKPIWWVDAATALFGIAASTLISFLTVRLARRRGRNSCQYDNQ
ncbi:MAG: VanZ family protein [Sedimentisphaerales bacterium]|nr:VanZ family protein [Sedimentisphaerales bacterium]